MNGTYDGMYSIVTAALLEAAPVTAEPEKEDEVEKPAAEEANRQIVAIVPTVFMVVVCFVSQ